MRIANHPNGKYGCMYAFSKNYARKIPQKPIYVVRIQFAAASCKFLPDSFAQYNEQGANCGHCIARRALKVLVFGNSSLLPMKSYYHTLHLNLFTCEKNIHQELLPDG